MLRNGNHHLNLKIFTINLCQIRRFLAASEMRVIKKFEMFGGNLILSFQFIAPGGSDS